MDETTSTKFSKSHAEFLQYLCNGLVSFKKSVIVTGHLYVTIDNGANLEYVVNEKLCKLEGEENINYISNSFPCFNDKLQEIYKSAELGVRDGDDFDDDLEAESKDDFARNDVSELQVNVMSQMSKVAMATSTSLASTDVNAVDLFKKTMLPLLEASAIKTELPAADQADFFNQDLQNGQIKDVAAEILESTQPSSELLAPKKKRKSRPVKLSNLSATEDGSLTGTGGKKKPKKPRVKRVPGERPFTCEICGKSFVCPSHLRIHNRIHSGDKPYECDECGKKFTQTSGLNLHKRTHTGERPFVCELCGKGFALYANLSCHYMTHGDDKPYKCEQCGKAFNTTQSLRRHAKLHTGLKPHKCEVCGFAFPAISDLNKHMRVHTGEKPYVCEICGVAYARNDKLKKHKLKHADPFASASSSSPQKPLPPPKQKHVMQTPLSFVPKDGLIPSSPQIPFVPKEIPSTSSLHHDDTSALSSHHLPFIPKESEGSPSPHLAFVPKEREGSPPPPHVSFIPKENEDLASSHMSYIPKGSPISSTLFTRDSGSHYFTSPPSVAAVNLPSVAVSFYPKDVPHSSSADIIPYFPKDTQLYKPL